MGMDVDDHSITSLEHTCSMSGSTKSGMMMVGGQPSKGLLLPEQGYPHTLECPEAPMRRGLEQPSGMTWRAPYMPRGSAVSPWHYQLELALRQARQMQDGFFPKTQAPGMKERA